MEFEPMQILKAWAAEVGIPLFFDLPITDGVWKIHLLDGGWLHGEMVVVPVNQNPPSFQITVSRGNMILDESWSDLSSIGVHLNQGVKMLQRSVRSPEPQWQLYLGEL